MPLRRRRRRHRTVVVVLVYQLVLVLHNAPVVVLLNLGRTRKPGLLLDVVGEESSEVNLEVRKAYSRCKTSFFRKKKYP